MCAKIERVKTIEGYVNKVRENKRSEKRTIGENNRSEKITIYFSMRTIGENNRSEKEQKV